MSRALFYYALWCLLVLLLFVAANVNGYSPFADSGHSVFFVRGASGPHHK